MTESVATKHVLCIDDDETMLYLLRFILERAGYTVTIAPNAFQGLSLMRRLKPDLVLLDLMMPGQDGQELYRQIQRSPELAGAPVIMVTARSEALAHTLGLEPASIAAYITKPFLPQDLLATVAQTLS